MPQDNKKQASLDKMVKEAAAKKYGLGTIVESTEKVSGAAEKINTLAADVERMKPIVEKVSLIQDSIKGEDGKDGVDGNHGNDGANGLDGSDGRDGVDGIDGVDGVDGKDGIDGRDGIDGTHGKDAEPLAVIEAIKSLKGKDAAAFSQVVGSKIDISHVRNAGSFIFNGKQYKTEELMHGGGSGGSGGGTVTTVSVVSANGLAGTVANATTTPAITLSTTITGVLKGNGTAINAAVANTDYQSPITLTTTGSSGAATFNGTTLNIPQYSGGGGTPGGLNTQLQYNNNGVFGGITGAVTDGTSVSLTAAHLLNPTINGAGAGLATLTYPNTSTSVSIAFPATAGTVALTSQLTSGTVTSVASADSSITVTNPTTTVDLSVVKAPIWTTARLLAGNSVNGSANVAFANKFIVQGTTDAGLSGAQFLGALGTGIVKNITTTGVLSIAVAADFPTLNQNTTGSAATLTTPRAINGVNFDGSAAITVTAAAGTLTGTTLNSTVVTSSITTLGSSASLPGSPTTTTQTPADNSTKIATTAYVDNAVLGQNFKEATLVATTANLVGVYLSNVFTYTATGTNAIDGVTLALGNRVLVKNQTTTFQNGWYVVTTAGAIGVAGVLTRSSDANTSGEFKTGDSSFVISGTVNTATTWAYTGVDSPTLGTDAITYVQAAGLGSYVAGNGLTLTGNSFAINTAITADLTTSQTLTNKTLTSPVLTTPDLGTPTALVGTSITGTGTGFTSGITNSLKTATGHVDVSAATAPSSGQVLTATGATTATWQPAAAGTVTAIGVTTANGVSGTSSGGATPNLTISLGAITPSTVNGNTFTTGTYTLTGTAGKTLNFTNSLILSGTDSTTMTFPSTSQSVAGLTATQTFTNKRITRRVVTTTQAAAPAINTDNTDMSSITGLAQAITSFTTNLSGTPNMGDFLEIQITDNGTARSLAFGASFVASTVALPTTTVISTLLHILFEWDSGSSKWICVAVA